MKKLIHTILAVSLLCVAGCNYLDIVPDNVATLDHAFTDKNSAEKYLATIYSYQPYFGFAANDPSIGASDEWYYVYDNYSAQSLFAYEMAVQLGRQSITSPYYDYWSGSNGGRGLFVALRDCNTFLENIDKVNDTLDDETKEKWIGEVYFFKAFYHFYLMRLYGAIPIIRENIPISAGVEEVRAYREPVDEVVKYIVEMCDEAMKTLPDAIVDPNIDYGHATKPAAAMLKAEALVWLASPLFNGNNDYADVVDNRGTRLFPTADPTRWAAAAKACKEAIDICEQAGIKLYEFTDMRYDLSETTKRLMDIRGAVTDPWNVETIYSHPRWPSSDAQHFTKPRLISAELTGGGSDNGAYSSTFKMAELFYSNHGVPIEEDTEYAYNDRYDLTTVGNDHYYYIPEGKKTAILNTYREPRFYADLGFDTGYWWGSGRTFDVGKGTADQTPWVIQSKQGEVSGKSSDIRYCKSGYFVKKTINFQTTQSSSGAESVSKYPWPVMRLADLYLLYAEALNESMATPDESVYEYIDKVRARAGLEGVLESWANWSNVPDKPKTQAGMRAIIHQERMIELAFEGPRYYDLRRWKEAYAVLNQPYLGWNVSQSTTEDYYVTVVTDHPVFLSKDYLSPIPEAEMLRNTNLVQNPGWE